MTIAGLFVYWRLITKGAEDAQRFEGSARLLKFNPSSKFVDMPW